MMETNLESSLESQLQNIFFQSNISFHLLLLQLKTAPSRPPRLASPRRSHGGGDRAI